MLQIGCGVALPALMKHCNPSSLTVVDISRDALSQTAGLLRGRRVTADLVHADACRTPFISVPFDVAVDFGTYYQVADTGPFLQEIASILDDDETFVQETSLSQLLAHPLWSLSRRPWSIGTLPLVAGRSAASMFSLVRPTSITSVSIQFEDSRAFPIPISTASPLVEVITKTHLGTNGAHLPKRAIARR